MSGEGNVKRIFVCSPYRGATQGEMLENCKRADDACLYVVRQGHAPFAPHLFYPRFLEDTGAEREEGLGCGEAWLAVCDEMWVFGKTISSGMRREMERAEKLGKPVIQHVGPQWEPSKPFRCSECGCAGLGMHYDGCSRKKDGV